jgi:hypothetical protein
MKKKNPKHKTGELRNQRTARVCSRRSAPIQYNCNEEGSSPIGTVSGAKWGCKRGGRCGGATRLPPLSFSPFEFFTICACIMKHKFRFRSLLVVRHEMLWRPVTAKELQK